jgi:YNFM family putative membrane transporter
MDSVMGVRAGAQRGAIWALYGAAVIVLADMYLTQPILPLLSAEFNISPATAGLSVSVVVLFIALASTAAGPLSDMLGRKPVIVTSCAMLVLPTLLCAFAPSFGTLLVFRALQGLCIPGITAVAVAYVGELVEPRAIGSAVGGWIAATVAGGLTGRVMSGMITDLFGWRAVFVVFAVLTLICAIWLALLLPRLPVSKAAGLRHAYRGMGSHLRNRRLLGAFIIGGALFFGFIGVFTYLPYYLTHPPFNLQPGVVAFAYLSYAAGIVTSPLAGRLSARISRRALMAIGLVITMIGITMTLITSLPLIAVSLLVVCAGMFTAQAIAPAFVNTVATQAKGGAGALYLMFYYLGGTFGGVLPGLAWQTFNWPGVVAVCLSALVVALLSNWLLCRER